MRRKYLLILSLALTLSHLAVGQSLDFYLKKGLENSPLLKEFGNQLRSGALDSLLTNATFKPQINQVSQALYAPAGKNMGYDEAITNGGNFSALLNIMQPLFSKRLKAGQHQEILLSNQAIGVSEKITETDLKQGITAQYLSAFAYYQQFLFCQTILKLLREEQQILASLVEKGVYLQTDKMNLDLSITSQEIAVKQAWIQYKNSSGILNFICGIAVASTSIPEVPLLAVQHDIDINSSPVMMKFKLDSLKNIHSKLMIDLNYRPKVSAFADAGFMAIAPENIPHNFGTSFGLNFSVPVYDGKQRKILQDKTRLTESIRQDYQKFYTSQFQQHHDQLKEQLKLTDELILGIKNQLSEQEKLLLLYKAEIEKGLVRFLDFLTAVNNYRLTKNTLTVSEMNRLQIINQMNYLK